MKKRWVINTPPEATKIEELSKKLNCHPVIANLLLQRGITSSEQAQSFFYPSLNMLHDPFLMKDMDKAVERLDRAIAQDEKILIYGDYDVDGTTAVSLLYKYLKHHCNSDNLEYYIPDRYTEGYGISVKGIDLAARKGVGLIIALDCGIKATEKVVYAKTKGVDFIICDHHLPAEEIPRAVAVLDPKRVDCSYPFDELSGCGVGFKLVQAYAQKNRIPFEQISPLLDLLVVSIASDIVPITDENRILAFHGLKQLNSNPSNGLKAIIDLCGLKNKDITTSDIVFKIGPRINASGRVQSGKEAVDLLISKDPEGAKEKGENINQYNETRKEIDKQVTGEANKILENLKDFESHKSIVIYNPDWHKGIIAIVASRLTELYYRPAIVLTFSNGLVTGSARSVQGFDVYKAIESCRDLLENFGGHTYAAGLSLKEENIPTFIERFENYVAENILPEQMMPQIDIDATIDFKDITPSFLKTLKQFNPFGPGNTKPIFCTKRVLDYGTSRLVGRELEHLKLEMVDSRSENIMNGIAFGMHEHNEYIKAHHPFDICYTIEENTHNKNIQLMIKDIQPSK